MADKYRPAERAKDPKYIRFPRVNADFFGRFGIEKSSDNSFTITINKNRRNISIKSRKDKGFKESGDLKFKELYDVLKNVKINLKLGENKYEVENIEKEKGVIKIKGKGNLDVKAISNKLSLKAFVPVAQNAKPFGPLKYTTKNPFRFFIYESYALPNLDTTFNKDGTRVLINKGAIFWYTPAQTTVNKILGFSYILVNIPAAEFIPNQDKVIKIGPNANVYYGWFNEDPQYPKQYVDFYIYQSLVNNYLYVFTVKKSTFFSNSNFNLTKNAAIA